MTTPSLCFKYGIIHYAQHQNINLATGTHDETDPPLPREGCENIACPSLQWYDIKVHTTPVENTTSQHKYMPYGVIQICGKMSVMGMMQTSKGQNARISRWGQIVIMKNQTMHIHVTTHCCFGQRMGHRRCRIDHPTS